MRISLPLKTVSLDPHNMEDIYSMMVNLQLHSSLFQYLPDGSIVPDIASAYQASEDHLTYTFTLSNKKFSDQSDITAKDVEKSLKRIFVNGSSISADLQSLVGYSEFLTTKKTELLGINAIGDNKIRITLSKPNPILLKQLATPDTAILKLTDTYELQTHIFSGKYKLTNNEPHQLSLALCNQDQYTKTNAPKKILYLLNEKDSSFELAQNNQIDLINLSLLNPERIELIKKLNFQEVVSSITHEQFLVLNPDKVSLDWRKFLISKFNTEEFIKELGFSHLEPAYGFVPTVLKGSIKKSLKEEINLNYNEENLKPIKLTINFMKGKMEEKMSEALKKIWHHPNLSLTFNFMDIDPYLETVFSKKYDASVIPKGLDYPDAMANLSYFKSDIKDNFFLVFDKEIDKQIEICSVATDKEAECFISLQKEILKKANVIPLFFGTDKIELWSKNVKKVPSHPLGLQFLKLDQIEMNNE